MKYFKNASEVLQKFHEIVKYFTMKYCIVRLFLRLCFACDEVIATQHHTVRCFLVHTDCCSLRAMVALCGLTKPISFPGRRVS